MRRILAAMLVVGTVVGTMPVATEEAAASGSTGPLTRVSGPSPFDDCPPADADSEFPVGPFEPLAVVNPKNPSNVAAVWSQDRFRGLVVGVSHDGGQSWRRVVVGGFTRCTGGRFDYVDDAWLSFGPDGVLHVYGKVFDASLTPSGALTAQSTDGGLSWSRPTRLMLETTPGAGNYSGGEITADPYDRDYVYAVTPKFSERDDAEPFRGAAYFTRSSDGGHRWSTPRKILDLGDGQFTTGHQTLVLPGGKLVGVFTIVDFRADPKNPRTRLAVIHSPDRGRSWSAPRLVAQLGTSGVRDPESGDPVAGSSRLLSDAVVDPRSGRIYLVWQDARWSEGRADAIALSSSADGGRTWTDPARVNATPTRTPAGNQQAFTPAVAVTDSGTVAVGYYDFRRNSKNTPLWTDRWLVRCTPSGERECTTARDFQHEVRLTDASFDMRRAKWLTATRSFDLSGYVGLTATGNDFLAVFPVTSANGPSRVLSRQVASCPSSKAGVQR